MSYYLTANSDPICASKRAYYVNYNSGVNILGGSGSFQPYQRLYGYNNPLKYALGANIFNDGGNTMRINWGNNCCCNNTVVDRFSWGQYSGCGGYSGPVDYFSWPTFPAQQNQTFATLGFDAFKDIPMTNSYSTFANLGFGGFGYNPYSDCGCNGYYPGYNYSVYPTVGYYGYSYPTNTAENGYYSGGQGSYTYDGQANAWNRKGYATADASGAYIQDNSAKKSTNINLGGIGKVAYSDHGRAISALGGLFNYSSIYGMKSIDLSSIGNAVISGIKQYFSAEEAQSINYNC